jgi:hypothetical protein
MSNIERTFFQSMLQKFDALKQTLRRFGCSNYFFSRDTDRILHSYVYRYKSDKTQVIYLLDNDDIILAYSQVQSCLSKIADYWKALY